MGSEAVLVEISSDEEDGEKMPAAAGKRKSPEGALDWAEKMLAEEDCGAVGEDSLDPTAVQELLDSLMDASGIVKDEKESVVDDKNAVRDVRVDEDDDDADCVILDGDPDKPVAVAKKEGPRRDAAEDELQIVAEKGEVLQDFAYFLYFGWFRYGLHIVVIVSRSNPKSYAYPIVVLMLGQIWTGLVPLCILYSCYAVNV
ncbi:hypothetical protein BAE44_0014231 [Dichanthelium oligosanthes]|uniref:Uncharacterized protein n=1 Tax=Dichanthelium oligosanthes TaxID=888268 RepID=A0A1E5VI45_9POAL|nr:hypothetical protein BAE44_0014231 [Dichanthelium oligosanthes]